MIAEGTSEGPEAHGRQSLLEGCQRPRPDKPHATAGTNGEFFTTSGDPRVGFALTENEVKSGLSRDK